MYIVVSHCSKAALGVSNIIDYANKKKEKGK